MVAPAVIMSAFLRLQKWCWQHEAPAICKDKVEEEEEEEEAVASVSAVAAEAPETVETAAEAAETAETAEATVEAAACCRSSGVKSTSPLRISSRDKVNG